MGIKYSFVDNRVYGTEDVNEIAQCLTGAGVMPFLSKDSYSASDLNSLTAALSTSGASLDGCSCSAQNVGSAEMCINVAQGIIFFESGVRLIVDAAGYSAAVEPNTPGYIYAHYSPSLQRADIVFGEQLPTDGECVELAQISENGSVKDLRVFARSKVGTMGGNALQQIGQDRMTVYEYSSAPSYGEGRILGKIDLSGIDISRYKYLLYKYKGWSYNNRVSELYERYIDLAQLSGANFSIRGTLLYIDSSLSKVSLEGDELIFYTTIDNQSVYSDMVIDFQSAMPYFVLV